MIRTKEHYDFVLEQLQRVQRALASLREQVEPVNKFNFDVMAEGYYDEIASLEAELATYKPAEANPPPSTTDLANPQQAIV